ncbi:hypothetical protein EW145_g3812 [Phellinidium pouzarii]|uniref:Uncharacterized protein n=1 Tax=Phellinidium pouzarii TaxID=167371 RepID=A0A4S4L7M6_9AGAM|nr:hypothetical protein EW145_g3812 [Phellinidium pouzarii]
MSPAAHDRSHTREPAESNGYDSEFTGEFQDEYAGGKNQHVHGHIYSDSEPKSRFTGRSRTSSGRRSRKTSSSSRELVRVLLEEKKDAERMHVQLEHAYGILRAESQRAADAERTAIETAERLKGLHRARLAAQQETARLQAELRMYKIQYDKAQSQLLHANDMISQSDLERDKAERAMEKMRRAVDKFKGTELARRAREEGWRQGREEVMRERKVDAFTQPVARRYRGEDRPLLVEDDGEIVEDGIEGGRGPFQQTLNRSIPQPRQLQAAPMRAPDSVSDTAPLPVPPPASVPVIPRNFARNFVPRQSVPMPVPRQIIETRSPPVLARNMPMPDPQRFPDHIVVRSPLPIPASIPRFVEAEPTHPSSSYTHRPLSRAAALPQRDSQRYPSHSNSNSQHFSQPSRNHNHARDQSVDIPVNSASASANRIYSQTYESPSSSDSNEFEIRPDSRLSGQRRSFVPGTGPAGNVLPEQEEIVPLPAPGQNVVPRPPSARPPSSAAYARPRGASVTSSSTTSSSSVLTETAPFPRPSRVAQLRHTGRRWSSESSTIPGIIIEPPSRPESIETVGTVTTVPANLSPYHEPMTMFSETSPTLPAQPPPSNHYVHDRPTSRTGFRYGSSTSPRSENIELESPGGSSSSSIHHAYGSAMGGGPLPLRFGPTGAVSPGISETPGLSGFAPHHPDLNRSQQVDGHHPSGFSNGWADSAHPSRSMSKTPNANRRSGGPPIHSGSAADYFNADHHSNYEPHSRHRGTHSEAVSNTDTNAFHDPDTDPEFEESPRSPNGSQSVHMRDGHQFDVRSASGQSGVPVARTAAAFQDARPRERRRLISGSAISEGSTLPHNRPCLRQGACPFPILVQPPLPTGALEVETSRPRVKELVQRRVPPSDTLRLCAQAV